MVGINFIYSFIFATSQKSVTSFVLWQPLTVNGIWGGGSTSLLQEFFVKNIGILCAYDF